MSFQLLPRHGCAPDMSGGQAMRWGLAVGKYPPCVFLLAVILWLETEAAGLTDLGSLRLEEIMNIHLGGHRVLGNSLNTFRVLSGLPEDSLLPERGTSSALLCPCELSADSTAALAIIAHFFYPAFITTIFANKKNHPKTKNPTAIFQVIPAARGADAEWNHTCKEFVCPAFAVSSALPLSPSILPMKDEESAITTACFG